MVFIWRNLKGNKQLKWNASHHMYERSEVLKSNLNRIKIFWSFFLSKASSGHYVIRKSEQGKLCGLRFFTFFFQFFLSFFQFKLCHFPFFPAKVLIRSGLNPLSSCKGSGLKDDVEEKKILINSPLHTSQSRQWLWFAYQITVSPT